VLLFDRAVAAVDSAGQRATLDHAERELRAAVAGEPSLASGWSVLSQLLRYRGRFAESDVAARRALDADAWLEDADAVLHRLFFGALFTADYAQARSLCDRGHEQFPRDWRFVECRLTLLRAVAAAPADADSAVRLLAELDRMDPDDHARREGRAYSPLYRRAVVAAVLARTGRADSARAMLARARAAAGSDPELRLSLAYDEASARLALGEPDSARALLAWTLARRPALRAFAARDPLLRALTAGPAPGPGTPPAGAAARSRPGA
jgi:hypothetical protein